METCRLGANFVLNFPAEHIGIFGVCDFWFGCLARDDRMPSKGLASGWVLLYLAFRHSMNRSHEYQLLSLHQNTCSVLYSCA